MADSATHAVSLSSLVASTAMFVRARPLAAFVRLAILVALLRVLLLLASPAELGVDEIQYWVWSRTPDWGYFSKPPLIAWIIAATTGVFGDAEWAVRLAAPLLHVGSSVFIALTGARLYDARVGAVAGLGWLTLPSVTLSSFIISTDAPLLFFWSAALYCFVRLVEAPRARAAAALGVAVGAGLLAKYAMIYFVTGIAVAAIVSGKARRALRPLNAAVAALIAGALIAPNIFWNARHDFQTVAHTAANANWSEASFSFASLAEFLAEQGAVFGPVFAVLLVWGLITIRIRIVHSRRNADLTLLAFVLPPLIVVAAQAFISRAHANWAAAAYPAGLLLVVAWTMNGPARRWLAAGLGLNLLATLVVSLALLNFALVDAVGASASVKRLRGWEAQARQVASTARGYDAILVDDRETMSALLYYARGAGRIVSLNSNDVANNYYEAAMRYDPARDRSVLFVTKYADARGADAFFDRVALKGAASATLHGKTVRTLHLYEAEGPRPRK